MVYLADQDFDEKDEIYSVPLAGGTPPTKLNLAFSSQQDVYSRFQISPDSTTVFYRADQESDGVDEIFRVSITGGGNLKLNGPLVSGGEVSSFLLSPDGDRVVYVADQDTNEVSELYSVPATGGAVVKLNGPLVLCPN